MFCLKRYTTTMEQDMRTFSQKTRCSLTMEQDVHTFSQKTRYLSQKTICSPIKKVSEYISMCRKGIFEVCRIFLCSEKDFSSGESYTNFRNSSAIWRYKATKWRWIFAYLLCGWDFSSSHPGEDPFEAVMCTVGAASKISYCLLKILFLIQNITWISAGFQNNITSLY